MSRAAVCVERRALAALEHKLHQSVVVVVVVAVVVVVIVVVVVVVCSHFECQGSLIN